MTDSTEKVQLYCLLSAWGTGSSAMAGYLDHCGLYTCPPHWEQTGDERTPNTFESLGFKDLLHTTVDQATFLPACPSSLFCKAVCSVFKRGERKSTRSRAKSYTP